MSTDHSARSPLFDAIVEDIEVPAHAYERARKRHDALGEWLDRDGSTIAHLKPRLYAQGSFRIGTAVRPLDETCALDVDQVCELTLASKQSHTQKAIKELLHAEVELYRLRYGVDQPAKAGHRCVTLEYADEAPLRFHLDELPSVPESTDVIRQLVMLGVSEPLAASAIAITDDRHRGFAQIVPDWYSSNPDGYAKWFADRVRPVARARMQALFESKRRLYASVDAVPEFEWKTPLQRAIQILKRHRDLHFRKTPKRKPVSILVTTIAASAYRGETDLVVALDRIADAMVAVANRAVASVPNPVNPKENFADRWARHPELRLHQAFGEWAQQLRADVRLLVSGQDVEDLARVSGDRLGVRLVESQVARLTGLTVRRGFTSAVATVATPIIRVACGPRPWGPQR